MLYIVSGPSSVGKSIIVGRFVEYNRFKRVVPFTSRQIRIHENEIEGKEYFFRDREELKKISNDFTTGYWDFPFNNIYGYSANIDQAINSGENFIILATTKIALSIKRDFPSVIITFLDFQTKEELVKRITERFSPNKEFVEEKLLDAITERRNKDKYDIILESDDPNILYRKLLSSIV